MPGQGEAGGEGPGPFLQALDTEELGAEGLLGFRAAAAPEEAAQRPQGVSQGDLPMVPRHASRRGVLIAWFRSSGCRGLPRLGSACYWHRSVSIQESEYDLGAVVSTA